MARRIEEQDYDDLRDMREEVRRDLKYVVEEVDAHTGDLQLTAFYTREEDMTPELFARFKKAVEGLEVCAIDLSAIVAETEKAIGIKPALPEDLKKKLKEAGIGHPEIKKDEEALHKPSLPAGPVLVQDVTIEMLREKATEYGKVFGMPKLLELNLKHGGAKKLSGVNPKVYGVLFGTMDAELAAASKPPTNGEIKDKVEKLAAEINEIPIETLREHAAKFIEKNGQPALVALLKAYGAEKLSGVPAEKRPALLEAISNA